MGCSLSAKWCQLFGENFYCIPNLSGDLWKYSPRILVSQLISLAAQLHSQQAGAAQWHRIHCTGHCTVGLWMNYYMILPTFGKNIQSNNCAKLLNSLLFVIHTKKKKKRPFVIRLLGHLSASAFFEYWVHLYLIDTDVLKRLVFKNNQSALFCKNLVH